MADRAFQPNAFQNNAFQVGDGIAPYFSMGATEDAVDLFLGGAMANIRLAEDALVSITEIQV